MKKLLLIIACAMSLYANAEEYKNKSTMNLLVEFTVKAEHYKEFKNGFG